MSPTYRVPGAILTEREHSVPLDHGRPDGPTHHRLHRARSPRRTARRARISSSCRAVPASRPTPADEPAVGLDEAGHPRLPRILLLDQRGTGRSTPVGPEIPGRTPQDQADYLTHFRADSIVRDASTSARELAVDRWSVLGQSFGGFTSMTYLSIAPEGLREAIITGGLSPVRAPARRRLPRDVGPAHREEPRLLRRATPTTGPGSRRSCARLDAEDVRAARRAIGSPRAGFASSGCGSATARAGSCSTT